MLSDLLHLKVCKDFISFFMNNLFCFVLLSVFDFSIYCAHLRNIIIGCFLYLFIVALGILVSKLMFLYSFASFLFSLYLI